MVVVTDFLLPIGCYLNVDVENSNDNFDKNDDDESWLGVIIAFVLLIPIYIVASAYTVVLIFSKTRITYITGDLLSGKHISDNISLMKTVQFFGGYAFAVVYCNLYFYRVLNKKGTYGKPKYYEKIIIPDYQLKFGISIFMILKLIVIISSIICTLKFDKIVFLFKNDLAKFNRDFIKPNFDDKKDKEDFEKFLKENKKIDQFLKSP